MEMKLLAVTGNVPYLTRPSISEHGDVWRFPRRLAVFLITLLALLGMREAHAVGVSLSLGLPKLISGSLTISVTCSQDNFLDTRHGMGWTLDGTGGGSTTDTTSSLNATLKATEFGAPGGNYAVSAYCTGGFNIANDALGFSIAPLEGSADFHIDKKVATISGAIGNGANRVIVTSSSGVTAEANTTSDYKISMPLETGEHILSAHALYERHTQLIGQTSVIIHDAPSIDITPMGPQKARTVALHGSAKSAEAVSAKSPPPKIEQIWYEWIKEGEPAVKDEKYLSLSPALFYRINTTFEAPSDGKYWYRFWTKAEDGQEAWSDWQYVIVDSRPPEITMSDYSKDRFIDPETRVEIKAADWYQDHALGLIEGGDSSGVSDAVMMQIRHGETSGSWISMESFYKGTQKLFGGAIPFDALPDGGDFVVDLWAKDRAGNETYLRDITFKKAPPPTVFATVGKQEPGFDEILLSINAKSDAKVEEILLSTWKKGDEAHKTDFKLGFSAAVDVEVFHYFQRHPDDDDDAEYYFQLLAKGRDKQATKSEIIKIIFDATAPTVDLVSPRQNTTHKTDLDLKVAVKDDGSGVKDVRMRVCQSAADCGKDGWIAATESDKPDEYAATLPLASLKPGAFIVIVRARDKAENELKTTFTYKKEIKARDALTASLTLDMVGAQSPQPVVAQQAPFVYRVVLTAKKQTVQRPSLRFRLPGELSVFAAPVLMADGDGDGDGDGAEVSINPQWDGESDDALLADGGILRAGQVVAIEVTVAVKEAVDSGVAVQSTIVACAGNLTGTLQALHRVTVGERPAAGNRVRLEKSVDAHAAVLPGALIKYTLRVGNPTFETVRKLLIRDHVPDHTKLEGASCGNLPAGICQVYSFNDEDVADGVMTHAGMCGSPGRQSDPDGRHVIWCLNGELAPLSEYSVDYTVRVDGGS
jgi:hypothetical protein